MKTASGAGVSLAQIRRLLKRVGASAQAERALLAVLEMPPYDDKISAAYTAGASIERARVRRAIETAWNDGNESVASIASVATAAQRTVRSRSKECTVKTKRRSLIG